MTRLVTVFFSGRSNQLIFEEKHYLVAKGHRFPHCSNEKQCPSPARLFRIIPLGSKWAAQIIDIVCMFFECPSPNWYPRLSGLILGISNDIELSDGGFVRSVR